VTVVGPPAPAPGPRVDDPSESDIVEVWGLGSFPASDAPANW
jgi:hypothetical protein